MWTAPGMGLHQLQITSEPYPKGGPSSQALNSVQTNSTLFIFSLFRHLSFSKAFHYFSIFSFSSIFVALFFFYISYFTFTFEYSIVLFFFFSYLCYSFLFFVFFSPVLLL